MPSSAASKCALPFLATLGSAAPFIGLFGTVWGIMRSFEGIAAANNTSLAVVAPGIAEALFATAMGLAAAIPAVVAYNKITVDLGRFAGRMQGLIGGRAGYWRERWRLERWPSRCRRRAKTGEDRYAAARRDQRDADGRRNAGAAGHLHGDRAALDCRRAARFAEVARGGAAPSPRSRSSSASTATAELFIGDERVEAGRVSSRVWRHWPQRIRAASSMSAATRQTPTRS